jgi:hypothetical protein
MSNPGHETTDVNTRWMGRVLIFLAIGGVLTQVIAGSLFLVLRKLEGPSKMNSLKEPPSPRLEIEAKGIEILRDEDAKILGSYGWVDRGSGVVRIPITAAMERVANAQK